MSKKTDSEITRERNYNLKNALDLMYLASCSLNSTQPDAERLKAMHQNAVARLGALHGLLSCAAFSIEKVTPLPHGLDQVKKKAIRKVALFDIERIRIFSEFEKHGIWYCPLKGIILKSCYPMLGMREMSDNDILCDPSKMAEIKQIMESLGYECEEFGEFNHDVYTKLPTLEFEMHHALFDENKYPRLAEYFSGIKDRLTGEGCKLRMTDADCYIYLICHIYKHYIFSGTGLRNLTDIYAYKRHFDLAPFEEYIDGELEKLGLLEFEKELSALAENVLNGKDLDFAGEELLLKLASAGTYGNDDTARDNRIIRRLNSGGVKQSKLKYYRKRVLPDSEYLKDNYPAVYKHKALYPLLLVYRPVKGAVTHPKKIIDEIKRLNRIKK